MQWPTISHCGEMCFIRKFSDLSAPLTLWWYYFSLYLFKFFFSISSFITVKPRRFSIRKNTYFVLVKINFNMAFYIVINVRLKWSKKFDIISYLKFYKSVLIVERDRGCNSNKKWHISLSIFEVLKIPHSRLKMCKIRWAFER